jgi:hypothetical protein
MMQDAVVAMKKRDALMDAELKNALAKPVQPEIGEPALTYKGGSGASGAPKE